MVSAIRGLLLKGEDDRTQIFILCEVVPMFRPVEIFLVSLLINAGKVKLTIPLPLLLNAGFLTWRLVDHWHLPTCTNLGWTLVMIYLIIKAFSYYGFKREIQNTLKYFGRIYLNFKMTKIKSILRKEKYALT